MIRPGIRDYFRLRRRADAPADVDAEIAFHLEERVRKLVARGYAPEDARAEAERRFGEIARARSALTDSAVRRERRLSLREYLASWAQDFRYSARALGHERFLAFTIVCTLALGLGANAAMFGIIDQVLLRGPAHVVNPEGVLRLYFTRETKTRGPVSNDVTGYVTYRLLKSTALFSGVAAYAIDKPLVGSGANAQPVSTGFVSADMFGLLGVKPALGRFFSDKEDVPLAAQDVVVLDWGYWQTQYGGLPSAIGQQITIQDRPYTIIGVAPRGFTGPERGKVNLWVPVSTHGYPTPDWPTTWNAQWLKVVARMRTGVTPEQAGAAVTPLYRSAAEAGGEPRRAITLSFAPIRFNRERHEAGELLIARWLVGVSAIVLLIACANVANLLLARALQRRREVGVRIALGIARSRLARLLFTEALLLALLSAVGAVILARYGGQVIRSALLPDYDWSEAAVNARVLFYTGGIALATGLLVGLAPAFFAARYDVSSALRAGVREGGVVRSPLRSGLTIAQAALSVILLAGGGLFVRSLWNIGHLHLGIEPDRVLAAAVQWPGPDNETSDQRVARKKREADFYRHAIEELRRRPDVENASASVGTPFYTSFRVRLQVAGWDSIPLLPGGGPYISAVTSQYFATAGTALLRGRVFTDADRAGSAPVAIVNETMGRTLWPNSDAIGKCLLIGDPPESCASIVGIVEDARRDGLRDEPAMQYYIPFGQEQGFGGTTVLVRPRGKIDALRTQLPRLISNYGAGSNYVFVETMQDELDPQIRPWRLGATLFCVFGGIALLIATIGMFSVVAYSVAHRRVELGIRRALGATVQGIIALIMRQGLSLAFGGVLIGVAIALFVGKYLEPLLFDTSARDVPTLVAVSVVLVLTAAVACVLPALRASRIPPVEVLRND